MSQASAVEALLFAALEKPSAAERTAFLDAACAGNSELRRQVERLLTAHADVGDFLNRPAVEQLAQSPDEPNATQAISASTDQKGPAMPRTEGEGTDDEDIPFDFLQPSTRPDSLGRIGHYEVLQILGKGGFGVVFRAFDEVLQRVVALKVMAPQLAATSPARKRFLREARSSAQVRHENVVQVYEVAEQPLPYLAMEFIPGETLQQKLDRVGPLDVPETLRIGRQIAEGLAAAHATDLIHRDIKPGNVLLEGGQHKVKITDFGLARTADDASISQSGILAGTPMYMAPEQALGLTLDQRADLFSLGSVLYQMVAGRPPFRANGTLAVLKRVAEDKPRAIREIIPETPQWLCDIIAKLHAKNPDERYQSAREVADLLADCEAQLKANHKLKDYSRIPRGEPQRSGRPKWVAAAAGVLLLVVTLVVMKLAGWTHSFRGQQGRRVSPELLVETGGQMSADGCSFTWSNTYEQENADGSPSVGVYFGTVAPAGRPVKMLYLVLYKHAPRKPSFVVGSRGLIWPGSGTPVEITDGPLIYGDPAKLTVRVHADPSTGKLMWEECTLNEQKIEMSRGRLFLVDLTANPAKWQQVNVELPRDLQAPMSRDAIVRVAEEYVPALRIKHRAVDDFFTARGLSAAPARGTGVPTESGTKDAKEAQEASAKQLGVPVETTNSIGMKFRLIPAGKFMMGSSKEEIDYWLKRSGNEWFNEKLLSEGPQHEVELTQPFYAGQTDVTVGQFRQFVKATEYQMASGASHFGQFDANKNWQNPGFAQTGDHPVVCVSWNDAVEFCSWLSKKEGKTYRLPTEAEWEYSCRAGSKGRWSFGDDETESLNYARFYTNSQGHTWPVAGLKGNAWGLYDMHGNVFEWCQDIYDANYYKTSPPKDPPGPDAGAERVQRGGSWCFLPGAIRSAFRVRNTPGARCDDAGFRVVLAISPPAGVPTESGAKDAKEAQEASAKQLGVPVEATNNIGMKLRLIPPGKFTMGSPKEEIDFWLKVKGDGWYKELLLSEGPQHEVDITQPFCMGQTDVTVGQFRQFVKATGYQTQAEREGGAFRGLPNGGFKDVANTDWLNPGFAQTDDHPVVCVSWNDAVEFCQWLSKQEGKTYRLPTEAEWEYSCRAGSKGRWSFGDNEGELWDYARVDGNSQNHSWPVAGLKENAWGLYDMHGNVVQWCQDRFDPNYYKTSPPKDPSGPAAGDERVIRGGLWLWGADASRSAMRNKVDPAGRANFCGFRVVLVVSSPKTKTPVLAVGPFTDADVQRIAALPAAEQVEEVRKELIRRNPGFDGQMETKIEGGVVTDLRIVTDKVTDITPIRAFSSLRVLDLGGTHTNYHPNGQLADLSPLKGMNLTQLTKLNLNLTKVGDVGLVHFKDCTNLTYLGLGATRVSDNGLAYFRNCKNLTSLELFYIPASDAGLGNFKDCNGLTRLNLVGTKVSDAGLANFKDCKNLTTLSLDRTQVGDAGTVYFQDCRSLTDLGLSETKVSDVGLAHFKDCKKLNYLSLTFTQVGDAGLAQLKGMPLKVLWIYNTGITDLTPLQGMPLEKIYLTPKNITRGLDILRDMKSLKTIGVDSNHFWSAAEFWQRYGEGEFR